MAVGDRVPQAVEAPVVDAATRDELTALASASPQALLARPVPSSVLARMARYATLLEWSRLARAAVEASVDIPSRRDLQAKARTSGSDIYINVMFRAFFPLPTPPVPPIPSTGGVLSTGRDRDPTRAGAAARTAAARAARSNRSSPRGPSIPTARSTRSPNRNPKTRRIHDRTRCRRASRR